MNKKKLLMMTATLGIAAAAAVLLGSDPAAQADPGRTPDCRTPSSSPCPAPDLRPGQPPSDPAASAAVNARPGGPVPPGSMPVLPVTPPVTPNP